MKYKFNQTPIKIDIFIHKILSPTNTPVTASKNHLTLCGGAEENYTYFDRLYSYILMSCVHSPFFWSGKFAMVIYSVPTIQK